MNKAVFKEDPAKTYFSGEGCFINELFNEDGGANRRNSQE